MINSGICIDLTKHPDVMYAVVWNGQLLPIRFAHEHEAIQHLADLLDGTVTLSWRLPKETEIGRRLNDADDHARYSDRAHIPPAA